MIQPSYRRKKKGKKSQQNATIKDLPFLGLTYGKAH